MLGFGAILPNRQPWKKGEEIKDQRSTSHCFAMNGDISYPYIHHDSKNNGILDTYEKCTKFVDMYGPTYFHEFLKQINDLTEEQVRQEKVDDPLTHNYSILLILTDGSVDPNKELETKEQIVRASYLPISIIIMGIGKPVDDFKFMKQLDGDKNPLYSKKFIDNYSKKDCGIEGLYKARDKKNPTKWTHTNGYQIRDCVQFVSLYDYPGYNETVKPKEKYHFWTEAEKISEDMS